MTVPADPSPGLSLRLCPSPSHCTSVPSLQSAQLRLQTPGLKPVLQSHSAEEIAALNSGTPDDREAGAHTFSVKSQIVNLLGFVGCRVWCSFSSLPFTHVQTVTRVRGQLPRPPTAVVCHLLGPGVRGGLGRCRRGGGLAFERGAALQAGPATYSEAPPPHSLAPAHTSEFQPATVFRDHKLFYACRVR